MKAEVLQIGEYHQQVEIMSVMVAETVATVQRSQLGTVILETAAQADILETVATVDYRLTTQLHLHKELPELAVAAVEDQEEDQLAVAVGAAAMEAESVYTDKAQTEPQGQMLLLDQHLAVWLDRLVLGDQANNTVVVAEVVAPPLALAQSVSYGEAADHSLQQIPTKLRQTAISQQINKLLS